MELARDDAGKHGVRSDLGSRRLRARAFPYDIPMNSGAWSGHSAAPPIEAHWVSRADARNAEPVDPAIGTTPMCHCIVVPRVDGAGLAREIFTLQAWSVQPCVRPVCASNTGF